MTGKPILTEAAQPGAASAEDLAKDCPQRLPGQV